MGIFVTIIAWIAITASAAGILFANRICKREMSREGLQILCSLIFCWVGTRQISSLSGLESGDGGFLRPWRIVGFAMLLTTLLLWRLSRRIN